MPKLELIPPNSFLMAGHKKQAWIVTGILLFIIVSWATYAVHESAVSAARAARLNSSGSTDGCPFSTKAPTKSSGCQCDNEHCTKSLQEDPAADTFDYESLKNLSDEEIEQLKKKFTQEQLNKCPHLKARKTKKKA